MRLLNVHTYKLEEFCDRMQVKYAILSHRWEEQEVLYNDMIRANGDMSSLETSMKGFYKIQRTCQEAARYDIQYVWIDTCCIDKSSSAELQEAINSMFRWYASAYVCYAYLSDVRWLEDKRTFQNSQWFKRGWTLQELLAPERLRFYDYRWWRIGERDTMVEPLSDFTGIPQSVLQVGFDPTANPLTPKGLSTRPCIASIMSWACDRKTTRIEDRAYSLLGLFNVNMPMLYGEGGKAFFRLQCEILNQTEDQSIFAWDGRGTSLPGLLAVTPDDFRLSERTAFIKSPYRLSRRKAHKTTNEGISLET